MNGNEYRRATANSGKQQLMLMTVCEHASDLFPWGLLSLGSCTGHRSLAFTDVRCPSLVFIDVRCRSLIDGS
jgi:hypothetical protein